jgi:hypothetical protein
MPYDFSAGTATASPKNKPSVVKQQNLNFQVHCRRILPSTFPTQEKTLNQDKGDMSRLI